MNKGGIDSYQVPIVELEPRIYLSLADELQAKSDEQLSVYSKQKLVVAEVMGAISVVMGGLSAYTLHKSIGTSNFNDIKDVVDTASGTACGLLAARGFQKAVSSLYKSFVAKSVIRKRNRSGDVL